MSWFDDQLANLQQQAAAGTSQPQTPTQGQPAMSQGAPGASSGGGGGNTGDVRAAINEYLARYPGGATREAYEGLFPYLQQMGFNVQRPTRAGGAAQSDDKIVLPDGSVIDLILDVNSETGTGQWGWSNSGYWVDGRPSATPGVYTPFSNSGGSDPSAPGQSLANLGYASGSALAPWTRDFQSPTADQVQHHPGFQYALDRAQQGIERGAASKGTLLTGGLQARLGEHLQNMGMQQYGTLRDFMRDDYMIDRDNFFQNQDRPFNRLTSLASLGRPA